MQHARVITKDGLVTERVKAPDMTRVRARLLKREGGHLACDECDAEVVLHADEDGKGLHFASRERAAHHWKCTAPVTEKNAKPKDKVHRATLERQPVVWNLRMGALKTAPGAGTQAPKGEKIPQNARIVTITDLSAMADLRRQIKDANGLNDPFNPATIEHVRFRGKRTERFDDRVVRRDANDINRLVADILFRDPDIIPMPYFFILHMRPETPTSDAGVIKAYDADEATDGERWISAPVRLVEAGVPLCLMNADRRSVVLPFNQVRFCVRTAQKEALSTLRRGADLLEHKKVAQTPVRMVSVLDEDKIARAILAHGNKRPSLQWGHLVLEIDIQIHDGACQMASDPKSWRETHLAGRNVIGG